MVRGEFGCSEVGSEAAGERFEMEHKGFVKVLSLYFVVIREVVLEIKVSHEKTG